MKSLKTIIASLCLSFFAFTAIQAQKFGYVNSASLLTQMPDVKSADSELQAYQKQLVTKGENMMKAFEQKYQTYMTEVNSGTLSKIQMQKKEGELAAEQQNIQKYEVEVQQKLLSKREELYKPILEKVQNAINAVGAEGSYTMIFDTSTGALLHSSKSDDLTSKVHSKLGI